MTTPDQHSKVLPRWLSWASLLFAIVVAFGAVVPDFYIAADDYFATGMMDVVDRGGQAGMLEKLYDVVFRAAGGGHFRPAQDVLFVVLYELFGVDRWIFAVMVVYALCHLASARLIIAIMTRLLCPPRIAFTAAFLFLLHPVFDENLASVQFGNNVPGLTSVLGACLLWLPMAGISRRHAVARMAGAGVLTYVAIGLGINLMVSSAVLLGLMAVAIGGANRSMRAFFKRGLVLSAVVVVAAVHRLRANGTVGTTMPRYQGLKPTLDVPTFLQETIEAAVQLAPSPTTTWASSKNPQGLTWADGSVPLWSADTCIVIAAAIGLVAVVVLMTGPRSRASVRDPAVCRLAPSFWFGLLLTVAMLLPYYLFIGHSGVHRYLYPAIAGIAMVAATVAGGIGRVLEWVIPRPVVAALGSITLLFVLVVFLRVDREAARSIAAGHRVAHAIVSTVSADVAEHPGIRSVFVIGQPWVIGRAGYSTNSSYVRRVVNPKMGSHLNVYEEDFFEALQSGHLTLPLREDAALYLVEADGTTVRRVPKGGEYELPPYLVKQESRALSRAWHLDDASEALVRLGSANPAIVESVLGVLLEIDGGARGHLITTAFESSAGTPALLRGVLELARRSPATGRALASQVAVRATPQDDLERAVLEVIARGNGAFDPAKVRSAAELERKAQKLARDLSSANEARDAFQAAHAAWADVGVARGDLADSRALCRIATLDDASLTATIKEWTEKKWWSLVGFAEAFKKARQGGALASISVRRAAADPEGPSPPGTTVAMTVTVQNASDLVVLGGVSPISARLIWSWPAPNGASVAAGEQWFPSEGLKPGEMRTMTWIATVPPVPGVRDLRVELVAFGKSCAVTDLSVEGVSSKGASRPTK